MRPDTDYTYMIRDACNTLAKEGLAPTPRPSKKRDKMRWNDRTRVKGGPVMHGSMSVAAVMAMHKEGA